jgi:hypothetical protein
MTWWSDNRPRMLSTRGGLLAVASASVMALIGFITFDLSG